SRVIIPATSRSSSSPDWVPNFRRNLLPLSSIGTPSGLHMTTKPSLHPVVADDTHTPRLARRWTFHVDVNGCDLVTHITPLLVRIGVSLFQIAREVCVAHVANTAGL